MQTTTLRKLVTTPGPFASVYFEDSHDTQDADKQLELRWRELRDQLAAQQAPGDTLNALETAVRDASRPVGRSGRALLAAGGSIVVDERLGEPPATPLSRVSDLPYVVPLTRYAEPGIKYVVAVVDQVNASVAAVGEQGRPLDTEDVGGPNHPVHPVQGGGSARSDMRRHTEESIRRNVAEIAEDVARTADRIGAGLIVLAGEIQGRRAVREALPTRLREIVQEVTHPDVAPEVVLAEKRRRLDEVLRRFDNAVTSERGLAVDGLEAVTAALVEGNVETLLIASPGDATVRTGESPTQIAVTEAELQALGATRTHERRADEAVPLAAIAVDADLVSVDSALSEGFGAILRHG